jgi:hypothetical protein
VRIESHEALQEWLSESCRCEVCGAGGRDRGLFLYLRPALDPAEQTTGHYLSVIESVDPTVTVERIRILICAGRPNYNYRNVAPIMCGNCASVAGLRTEGLFLERPAPLTRERQARTSAPPTPTAASSRAARDKARREANDKALEERLALACCDECGGLDGVTLVEEEPGQLAVWKRDLATSTFSDRIGKLRAVCRNCASL